MSEVNLTIFDTTLRDGAQSLPEQNQFPKGTKADIAGEIAALGIGVIEAGFPRTVGDADEVRMVSKLVGNNEYAISEWRNNHAVGKVGATPTIAGLCRTTRRDIDVAWEAVQDAIFPRIHTFVSTDREHMAAKFPGKTPEEVHLMGRDAVMHAKSLMIDRPQATVEFSAEAASTTEEKYLEGVMKSAVDEGADVINVPDTVGQRNPFWMRDFYSRVIDWVVRANPDVTISAHNHNDLAMATANSFSLVSAAAEYAKIQAKPINIQIETTISGLGERAGNADVFSVAASIFKFAEDLPVDIYWRFNPERSVKTANRVLSMAGIEVHRQAPVVGRDTLVHRSGIHSDGVIKGGHRIYTPHDPTFWGQGADAIHEEGRYQGKSGRAAIARTSQ